MTEFNVTGEWSSGNILFKNGSGSEIGYIDGDNTSIVAVGSLVASKKVIGSSDASVAGTFTMGSTGTLTVPNGVWNCPEIRGRTDADLSIGTGGDVVAFSVSNPTTLSLLIEKVILRVTAASSSSSYFTSGVANTDSSSATNLWVGTVATSTAGIVTNTTDAAAAIVVWGTSQYWTGTVASSSDGILGLTGKASAFWVSIVST